MSNLFQIEDNELFRIWFDIENKREYYETPIFELGNTNKITQKNQYNVITRKKGYSLKDYKFKEKKISITDKKQPYCEKLGLVLINFLNTDFSDFDKSFDNFYSIYGCDFLYNYSIYETYEESFDTEKDFYDFFKILHNRGFNKLTNIQNSFRNAVDFIYNLNNNKSYSNYSYKERYAACLIKNEFNLKNYFDNLKIESKINITNKQDEKNTIDSILKTIDYKSSIANIFIVDTIENLLFAVLHQLIDNDFLIKKCQICGKYFVPSKSNEIYCEFINETNNTICRDVGAFQSYKQNIENKCYVLSYAFELL